MMNSINDSFAYRSRRLPAALDPSYIKMDERTMADLMAFAGKYSYLVNYYQSGAGIDPDKEPGEHWERFFAQDQDVLLAELLRVDLDGYEECFFKNWSDTRATESYDLKKEKFTYLFRLIIEISRRLDMLYTGSVAIGKDSRLLHELKQTIRNELSTKLADLMYYAKDAARADALNEAIQIDVPRLSELWQVPASSKLPDIYTGNTGVDKINTALDPISDIFEAFIYALRYIAGHIPLDLESIYLERDDHKPHMALYITFLKLFSYAQAEMNTITGRHLDLYYYDVLQQSKLPPVPDKTFLAFELAQGISVYPLPAGTRLPGGKTASGASRVYTTDNDIFINTASIASLHTLFVSSSPLIRYGTKDDLVNNIYYSLNPVTLPGTSWPTLGQEQLDLGDASRTMSSASVGFALASPAFILTEGEREVTVMITFDKTGFSKLVSIAQEIGAQEYRSDKSVLSRVFSQAFHMRISADPGWYIIEKYIAVPDLATASISFRFHLQVTDPALTGYSDKLHGNAYDTSWPLLELILDEAAPVYAYSLLKDLVINDISIVTEVTGMRKADIFNNLGRVAIGKPFQAFGPMPVVGSYLLVGKSEMMSKELQSMRLSIEWQDLPAAGFEDYYSAYKLGINNDSFKVRLSVLKDAVWVPAPSARQSFQLFVEDATSTAGGTLSNTTVFDDIDLARIRTGPRFDLPLVLDYPSTTEGFFRLELADPPFAFAHSEYNAVLSDTISYNVRKKENLPVPNLPYTPVISSLTLDYTASLSLRSQDASGTPAIQMFHIHPFGIQDLDHASGIVSNTLVPQYNDEGTLFIGLTGLVPPQPLRMLFQFADGTGDPDGNDTKVKWSYLAGDKWYDFDTGSMLGDTTNGFTSTGIVSLDIPSGITDSNTIMPKGLYWIKAAAVKSSDRVCETLAILTQAVSVTEIPSPDPGEIWIPLPAGTIRQFETNIPQVKKIIQPVDSFGGQSAENSNQFYQRVSERVKHRQRAIYPSDYEQLVMQNFPEVSLARCLPCKSSSQPGDEVAGSVMLVVVPSNRTRRAEDTYPTVDAGVLKKIEELLIGNMNAYLAGQEKELKQALISPFVTLEVRNPSYERVKIACAVKFKRGYDPGYYTSQMNNELVRYISPWLFDKNADAAIGASLYRSNILGFIERLPYIDLIRDFSIVVIRESNGRYTLIDSADKDYKDEIRTAFPWSLLVSDDHHAIALLDESVPDHGPVERSIGNMIINEDFIIASEMQN